jgi:hypothetical protein
VTNGSIDCRDFEDRIHQILDDRLTLPGDDLLMAHVAKCAKCELILNDYDSVDDSIKLLPDDLANILKNADRTEPAPFASKTLAWAAALAAVIVISLNVFNSVSSNVPSTASNAPTEPAPLAIVPKAPKAVAPSPRITPDTSPFSRNFSVANSMPMIPSVPSWGDISKSLDPLEPTVIDPVLSYSSKIPAVRPVHCSFNATISVLKKSLSKPKRSKKPDLGFSVDPRMLALA